jgi:hypothetical protein
MELPTHCLWCGAFLKGGATAHARDCFITTLIAMARGEIVCGACDDEGWVCERHPDRPVDHDDCDGAGMPCPRCNGSDPPRPPRGFVSLVR